METSTVSQPTPITANFNANVEQKDFKFRWRKDKLGNQRQTIEFQGAVPSVQGIIAILEKGGKGLDLLKDAVYDVMRDAYGSYLADNATATNVPTSLDWEAVANQPKEDRRSAAITEEQWEEFGKDYVAVMTAVAGKTADQAGSAVQVYMKKFNVVKTNKEVLNKLKQQLDIYKGHTTKGEEFTDILETLDKKLDLYLNSNETEMLINNL